MADGPLPVNETAKKPSKANILDSKFKLQLDMYSLQRKPSVSPSSLSEESYRFISLGNRNEEAPVKSRSSSSTSTSENIPAINVDDKHNEADIDSEDEFFNYKNTMGEVPECRVYSSGLCELTWKSFREYLHHQKNDHSVTKKFYECAISNFATLKQQNLIDHKRSNCVNTAADPLNSSHSSSGSSSRSPSHSSTDSVFLEERENYILVPPHLNSPKRNTTYIKAEVKEPEKHNHLTPTDDGSASLSLVNTAYTTDKVFDTAGEVFDTAGEVFDTAGEVFDTAGEVFDTAGEVFDTAGEVFDTAGEVFDTAGELVDPASEEVDPASKVFDKTKMKTRQEVDPNKYFEVINADGVIFACSQCGNKYKWKKSLNKHWKEKHNKVLLLKLTSFPGLHKLLQTGKYTYIEHGRKLYDNRFLRSVQIKGLDASPPTIADFYSHQSNKSPTMPMAFDWTFRNTLQHTKGTDSLITTANPGNPAAIPQFPTHGCSPSDKDIRDLSYGLNQSPRNAPISRKHSEDKTLSSDQEQPLDLSKHSSSSENNVPEILRQNVLASSSSTAWSRKVLSQSDFSTNTESFTSYQMHKRVVCFSCKVPLQSMDHLNSHFMIHHFQLLAKYKEDVKKIPHGLQQCYHLLDMEIIEKLGYQDLGSLDRTILTCNRCGFEAEGAADLQKHSVIHAEERAYVCMVCGTKYMHKWDLVSHFEKRHEPGSLPNPYRRIDRKEASKSSEEENKEPLPKKAKLEEEDSKVVSGFCNLNSAASLEGIVGTIPGRKSTSSNQQNSLDLMTEMQTASFVCKNTTSTEGTPIEQNTNQTAAKNYQSPKDKTVPYMPYAIQDIGTFKPNRTLGKDTKTLEGSKLKQFRCPECEFTCVRLSQLEKHRRIHTDEKPFKCPTPNCPYRTKWKWDVTKHLTRCGASGKSGVGKRSIVNKKKGRGDRKSLQSTSSCSSQSINGNASPSSNTEAQNDYSKTDSKALSKKNSGGINSSCDHNNHTAETKDLQVTSSKQAIRVNSKKHKTSSGHSPSKMVWRCFHCSFTTHSQAMLKKHSLGHFEDKPFRCDVCSYSSKWASDLMKHKRCYSHFLKSSDSQEIKKTHEEFQPRFKCFHCTLCFITLQQLTDHHRTAHAATEPSQPPRLAVREAVVDQARIKHPRKRMLYIQCLLCPFKAPHLQMLAHLNEDIHCLFCKSLFEHKASFFDHLITHEEFIPNEWEPYFLMSEKEQLQADNDKTYLLVENDKTNKLPVKNDETYLMPVENDETYLMPVENDETYLMPVENDETYLMPVENDGTYLMLDENDGTYQKLDENDGTYQKLDENDKTNQLLVKNEKANQTADYEPPGRHAAVKEINQNYPNFKDVNNDKNTVDSCLLTCQPAARSGHILASQKRLQPSMHSCDWCLEEFTSLTSVYEHARLHHLNELNDPSLGNGQDRK